MKYELTCDTWGPEEYEAIARVMKSKRFTMGEEVAAFEKEFAAKMGSRYAVMVNSGSSANLIAVAALFYKKDNPLQAGDCVVVPAISWATTYYPLLQYGLRPIFCDVDLDTLNVGKGEFPPKGVRLIVGVSILGNPAPLENYRKASDALGCYFIEDNCESMGATLNGKQCGTFGDMGTYSTFFSHHISTMEGGMVVTDNRELYELCVCLRAHGWTRNLPQGSLLFEKKEDDFYEQYRFILPGYNVRPIEMAAAIGREQLKKLDSMVEKRRANASYFKQAFKNDKRFILQKENGNSSWFSFTMIVNPDGDLKRETVLKALKAADIEYRIITGGNFLRHDVIEYFDYTIATPCINADIAHDYGFFVGNAPTDLRAQIDHLKETLSKL